MKIPETFQIKFKLPGSKVPYGRLKRVPKPRAHKVPKPQDLLAKYLKEISFGYSSSSYARGRSNANKFKLLSTNLNWEETEATFIFEKIKNE